MESIVDTACGDDQNNAIFILLNDHEGNFISDHEGNIIISIAIQLAVPLNQYKLLALKSSLGQMAISAYIKGHKCL